MERMGEMIEEAAKFSVNHAGPRQRFYVCRPPDIGGITRCRSAAVERERLQPTNLLPKRLRVIKYTVATEYVPAPVEVTCGGEAEESAGGATDRERACAGNSHGGAHDGASAAASARADG